MNRSVAERLEQMLKDASNLERAMQIEHWSSRVAAFLKTAISWREAGAFEQIRDADEWQKLAKRVGYLEGLIAKGDSSSDQSAAAALAKSPPQFDSRKLFVVHGHDVAAKESVARFLEKVKLDPIILHEQPNGGRTIIEKFETYAADVGFAVVLLTPDDAGCAAEDMTTGKLKPRARQNVITELGFFIGKLGRRRVCALHKSGVELPSDYSGVLYVPMDDAGAWKTSLAQELVEAKMSIDIAGLLGS